LDGANGTKALENAEALQRPETVAKQQNDARPTKNLRESSITKVLFYSRIQTKKEEKQLAWKKEVISSSSPSGGCFFFPHKSARAKSGGVFLIVGKYHLWYLTLNAR
tara:strand:- start:101 stop:421 length:321 start_codon:yes stop_codon:yes gene_type:complete